MNWSVESLVLVATGALFLVAVGASFLPTFQLTTTSRITFAIGATALIGSAVTLAHLQDVRYPSELVYLLPVVPLLIIGVLVRDAIAWTPASTPAHVRATSIAEHTDEPSRAAFFPPGEVSLDTGEGGDGSARARAANPETSPEELAEIAFAHADLRSRVAANPATPSNVLEWLASHGDPVVHAAISARTVKA